MDVHQLINTRPLPTICSDTFKDQGKTIILLEDLFNWADSNYSGTLDKHEFSYFMIASTLVHSFYEAEKDVYN